MNIKSNCVQFSHFSQPEVVGTLSRVDTRIYTSLRTTITDDYEVCLAMKLHSTSPLNKDVPGPTLVRVTIATTKKHTRAYLCFQKQSPVQHTALSTHTQLKHSYVA